VNKEDPGDAVDTALRACQSCTNLKRYIFSLNGIWMSSGSVRAYGDESAKCLMTTQIAPCI